MTTEEYFKLYSNLFQFEEGNPEYLIDKEDFKKAMISFAEYHVKEALKKASNTDIPHKHTYKHRDMVDKDSILNCYTNQIQ